MVFRVAYDGGITTKQQLLEHAVEEFDRRCEWGATADSDTVWTEAMIAAKVDPVWEMRLQRADQADRRKAVPRAGRALLEERRAARGGRGRVEVEAEVEGWLAEPHDLMLRVTASAGKTRAACRQSARNLRPGKGATDAFAPTHELAAEMRRSTSVRRTRHSRSSRWRGATRGTASATS